MPNMSYCRFQNTRGDLADCVDALSYGDLPTSVEEIAAAKRLANLCEEYLAAFEAAGEMVPEEEDEEDEE